MKWILTHQDPLLKHALALYYRGSGSSDAGLIILGSVHGDTERLATATEVTIETAS
ncbi:hypothetical protein OG407_01345 [Streptomyces sp. NBC_01515]|uniref:hypothetical protein n=1 Tax=Streptomyces sp. NBC_01515 TaxID=2903890 RepID=UPI00386C01DB